MAKIGYARVSTAEQNEARQIEAFKAEGISDRFIYLDKQSGASADRPHLRKMLDSLRPGDVVYVESISRLARNTRDLLAIVDRIQAEGAALVSTKEAIDTDTPSGRFMLTVFAAMAELERDYIKARQAEGIAIAKEAGKYTGRQKIAGNLETMRKECAAWRDGKQTARQTMDRLGMLPNTFYRRVKEYGL